MTTSIRLMQWLPRILCILAILFMTRCGKDDNTVNDKIGTAKDFLFLTPEFQPGSYRNMDRIFNTRIFKRGTTVFPLPKSSKPLTSVKYSPDGINNYDIDDFISRNNIAGLLIIKNGEIVLERYALGNNEASKWTSFSVAKSVTSTLIGIAIKDGIIKSINDPMTNYLPQMKGTAYDGVTIRQLLQMSSGVDWNEDYRDPLSSFTSMFQAIVAGTEGGIIEVMSKLTRSEIPGKKFLYSTGETYLEGKVLKAALGNESLSGFLSRKIWANMGMESDGYWLLESQDGDEFGGGNLSMTLRDYGRFGLFIQNNGIVNGISVLPQDWVAEASHPASDSPQCNYGELYSSYNNYPDPYNYPLGYGYNWWSMPTTAWGAWEHLNDPDWWGTDAIHPSTANFTNLEGSFTAEGVFGQFIHINQKEKVVSIIWSAWKDPWIDPKEYESYSFINAATGLLH